MGLFSDRNVIQVASVAYNMAGDITDRVSVLKSTVSRHVLLGERKVGLGERVVDVQLNGPTMDQRAWFRWAKNHYGIGVVAGRLGFDDDVDEALVAPHVPVPSGYTALVDEAEVRAADITIWAEQWILDNRPADIGTDWIVDLTPSSTMIIQFEDLTSVSVPVTTWARSGIYVVAYYRLLEIGQPESTAVSKIYIYKVGSGNAALDALYVPASPQQDFFPAIPLRINNLPIDHSSFDAHFPIIARAYKKATGEKIDKILESIEDNPNIGDVDYATLVFGVELNTKEKCGLRYLYEFFKSLIPIQRLTVTSFQSYLGRSIPNYPAAGGFTLDYRRAPSFSTIRVNGTNSFMAHNDIRLNWVFIDETIHAGLGKPGAKVGDLWIESRPNISVLGDDSDTSIFGLIFKAPYSLPHCRLFHQTGPSSFQVLDIYGMIHQNFVYGGVAVRLTTRDALTNIDEDGFVVPLHYPTLRKMPLVLANQLALSNRHVIFNCYNVVKVRWYQRGIFKILIGILISIAVAFIFPGSVGLFGTALQVGTQAGLTGVSAIIFGATVNAIAAIVLVTVLEKSGAAIFGEEFGAFFAQLVTFLAFQAIGSWASGAGFALDWGSLFRIDNLMGLLNSALDAVSKWINGEIQGIQGEIGDAVDQYKRDADALNKQAFDLLGAGGGAIDPLMFTQALSRFYPAESRDAFLQRTLMTGSDLIDLSYSMIEDFVELNLKLDNKIA